MLVDLPRQKCLRERVWVLRLCVHCLSLFGATSIRYQNIKICFVTCARS